jgi:hypothetical protein
MARARPLEIKALLPLLEQDWDDWENPRTGRVISGQERLIEALILELDRVRESRTSYVGVLQIGGKRGIYTGLGPFPGIKSAEAALMKHPAISDPTLVSGAVIVPIQTPEGFEARIKELDLPTNKKAA